MEQENYLRIIEIDKLIKNNEHPNCKYLQDLLKVSERTILRDIDALKEVFLAPIKYSKKHNGYFYSDDTFSLSNVQLTEGDFISILIGKRLLNAYKHTPFYEELTKAYHKLANLLPEFISIEEQEVASICVEMYDSMFVSWQGIKNFKLIIEAIQSRNTLKVEYSDIKLKNKIIKIQIDPYKINYVAGFWYLLAYDKSKERYMQINVKKIINIKKTKEVYVPLEDKLVVTGLLFKEFKEQNVNIKVKFSQKISLIMEDRFREDASATISRNTKSDLIVHFMTNDLDSVYHWLLSFGPLVEVLEPIFLRSKIRKDLISMLSIY